MFCIAAVQLTCVAGAMRAPAVGEATMPLPCTAYLSLRRLTARMAARQTSPHRWPPSSTWAALQMRGRPSGRDPPCCPLLPAAPSLRSVCFTCLFPELMSSLPAPIRPGWVRISIAAALPQRNSNQMIDNTDHKEV